MKVQPVFDALPGLMEQLGIAPDGVIHVGAHKGQEVPVYRRIGFGTIRLAEANPALCERLPSNCERVAAAVTARPGPLLLHIPRNTRDSSILVPATKPVERVIEVPAVTLASIQQGCNVLVCDVQGAELEVLDSGNLDLLDLIVIEACVGRRYKEAALRSDIIDRLANWRLVGEYPHRKTSRVSDLVFAR